MIESTGVKALIQLEGGCRWES